MAIRANVEISDQEKQLFAETVDEFDRYLLLDVTSSEDIDFEGDEDMPEGVSVLERCRSFRCAGDTVELLVVETLEDLEVAAKGWYVTVEPKETVVDGIRIITRELFCVDYNLLGSGDWVGDYEKDVTSQSPSDLAPKTCPTDLQVEVKNFYSVNPTEEQQIERKLAIDIEREEHQSERPLEFRFTKARFSAVMSILKQLGPDNLLT